MRERMSIDTESVKLFADFHATAKLFRPLEPLDAPASASDIRSGKKAYDSTPAVITGSMPDVSISQSRSGTTVTASIGAGYSAGSSAQTVIDVSATASENDVLNGKTFFSGSLERKTGTRVMPVITQDATTKVVTIV